MSSANYGVVGKHYSQLRNPDPRIAELIHKELANVSSVINIGAGTGSYEPYDKVIAAVEPSQTMIEQREEKPNTTIYKAAAEDLPFEDLSFDASLAILTIHHWSDWRAGLKEAYRVSRNKIVLFTWVGMPHGFWLFDYLPEIAEIDSNLFPTLTQLENELGNITVQNVPIPSDCTDGFLCAYWARPEYYLDPIVRSAISTFSRIADVSVGLKKLQEDIDSGNWSRKYGHLLDTPEYDFGYRLITCNLPETRT